MILVTECYLAFDLIQDVFEAPTKLASRPALCAVVLKNVQTAILKHSGCWRPSVVLLPPCGLDLNRSEHHGGAV
jgi:hypothetical protein